MLSPAPGYACSPYIFQIMKSSFITKPSLRQLSLSFLLLLVAAAGVVAQSQAIETGKFRLHKFEQPIGEETYTIKREGDGLVVTSSFEFTDRGTEVPLTAELHTRRDLTPTSFDIKGNVSRFSTIDSSVEIKGTSATIREDKGTRQAAVPPRFFTM